MAKKKKRKSSAKSDLNDGIDFTLENSLGGYSSKGNLRIDDEEDEILSLAPSRIRIRQASATSEDDADPVLSELANPMLPELPREDRARLQMQSPNRLYFYWALKTNPFQTLKKLLRGRGGSYVLTAKLVNLTRQSEEIFPVDPEGNWWFNVDSDSDYRAEIGFYAPNRPYIRILFSNQVRTPRKSPSTRTDYTPSFTVNAQQFAEVLDVAGYQRDAFDVALAGDDETLARNATEKTYARLVGKSLRDLPGTIEELRIALLALAAGYSLKDLEGEIDPALHNRLSSEFAELSAEKVLAALKENFDIETEDYVEEESGQAVFGASIVHFPKRLRKRTVPKTVLPKLRNISKIRIGSSPAKKRI